jgi:hypothetical protein
MSLMLARRAVVRSPSFRGLLDDYPGAAAAYSLRPLSAAWRTQPVVRVRRSNDDAEADFTAAQVADGTLTGWTGANDGFVVTWYDQSGEGRNATQATAANQPRIVAGGVVDATNVRFDGSDDWMDASGLVSVFTQSAAPISYFGVHQTRVAATLQDVLFGANTTTSTPVQAPFRYRTTDSNYLMSRRVNNGTITANAFSSYASNLDENQLISSMMGPGNLYLNGALLGGEVLPATEITVDNVTMGARRQNSTAPSAFLRGSITEIIAYDFDQSANRAGIESNINAYYGIYTP